MSLSTQSNVKFRPALTMAQLSHILSLLHDSESPIESGIKKVIVPLLAKIEIGAISPAYTLSEQHQAKIVKSKQATRYESGAMTPEEEASYERDVLGM